jgi:GTP1/Obg family GTP-binding protein
MMKNIKTSKTTRRIQPIQKSAAPSAKPTDRVTDLVALKRAKKLSDAITQHYSMRKWAQWTYHQKHGWWSHVSAENFDEIRFTWRDLDDLEKVHQRCLDEKHFDQELLRAMDDITTKQNALTISIEDARQLLRRKARALFIEQEGR